MVPLVPMSQAPAGLTDLNVRNIPDETKRKLAAIKGAQDLTYAELITRLVHLLILNSHKAREKPAGAAVVSARAMLDEARLRYDLEL